MTIIRHEINDKGFRIEVNGHTGFAEMGKDIVCAGISTLIQSLLAYSKCNAYIEDGYVYCEGDTLEGLYGAEMCITGFKLIEKAYPSYVMCVEGCPIFLKK